MREACLLWVLGSASSMFHREEQTSGFVSENVFNVCMCVYVCICVWFKACACMLVSKCV